MSAGTITLTNGSAIVGGSGTSFATELAAGDFIVSTVGGVPYTLPVKSVESNTQLTLVSNFTGPTQSGAAWSAVPRVALNMVTAALVAQSAEALRGLNYDKQNWQQVYSAAGNITVKLPDGTTFTGPSWKYLSDNMATKSGGAVPVNQGGTGSTTASGARTNLGLGTFVTQEDQSIVYGPSQDHALVVRKDEWGVVVSDNGNPVPLGTRYGGTGATTGDYWGACTNIGAIRQKTARFAPGDTPTNIYWKNSTGFITGQVEGGAVGAWIDITSADEAARMQLIGFYGDNNGKRGFGYKVYNPNSQSWYNLAVVRDTSNTTVDSNGFIKIASPIVKIYGDGRYDTNDETEGVTVTRLDVGQYLIDGCEALNSDAAWGGIDGGFDIPTDRNKQPLIWLDYEVNAAGSVLVKTYHRTHPDAPSFARNEKDGVSNGDPVDIPRDQFVSVRVEMPADSLYNKKHRAAEQALTADKVE
ncbi:phage tail fiber protein [Enterobacter asburiae]|uniref:phage tail fiber protein n=1 Tax=Enterobacter asburiae TaxID=61645 RepID=UPI001E45D39C|nr:phage tail protein [Enterobacter asburiae]MCE1325329.1 phage tail protein [Enterobacter asburiae]